VKEVALKKILNDGRVYKKRSVITRFFPVDPDDHVIMESQCIIQLDRSMLLDTVDTRNLDILGN